MVTTQTCDHARFKSKQLAKAFGVSIVTLDRWVSAGVLRPEGHGRFSFNTADALACFLARDLRARGFGLEQCGIVANWIRAKGVAELQAEWEHGQRYLLTVETQEPFHRQWTSDEIFHNDSVNLPEAFALGLPIAVVDLQAAYRIVLQKLTEAEGGEQ